MLKTCLDILSQRYGNQPAIPPSPDSSYHHSLASEFQLAAIFPSLQSFRGLCDSTNVRIQQGLEAILISLRSISLFSSRIKDTPLHILALGCAASLCYCNVLHVNDLVLFIKSRIVKIKTNYTIVVYFKNSNSQS